MKLRIERSHAQTNRIDDIDEVIVSRCIALIRYHAPDAAASITWQLKSSAICWVRGRLCCKPVVAIPSKHPK